MKKIRRVFLLAKVLESASSAWFFSTYILFLTANGLSLLEANILNVVFMSVSTIFDPFTGNLADRIGQRKVYTGGLVFWGGGMLVYGLKKSFGMFALAEVISAIGHALMSEAMESWLRNQTGEQITKETLAKSQLWSKIATIPTAIAGGYIGSAWGLEWPWILSAISSVAAAFLIWMMSRGIPEKADGANGEKVLTVRQSVRIVWGQQKLREIVVVFALTSAVVMPFNMFWPIVFRGLSGGRSAWLGWLWVGIAITSAIGAKLSVRVRDGIKSLAIPMTLIAIPMAMTGWAKSLVIMIGLFLVHEIGRGMWPLAVFNYSNRHIPSHIRSTINSIRSAGGTIGGAAGLLLSGLLTKWLDPVEVWVIFSIGLLMATIWILSRKD